MKRREKKKDRSLGASWEEGRARTDHGRREDDRKQIYMSDGLCSQFTIKDINILIYVLSDEKRSSGRVSRSKNSKSISVHNLFK